jgi:archaellin
MRRKLMSVIVLVPLLAGFVQAQVVFPSSLTAIESYDMPGYYIVCTTTSGPVQLVKGGNVTPQGKWTIISPGNSGNEGTISIKSASLANNFMRQVNFVYNCEAASDVWLDKLNSSFIPEPGLADPTAVSFRGEMYPHMYLQRDDSSPMGLILAERPENLGAATFRFSQDPERAKNPIPANKATDVPRETTLGWTPGVYAATHDVYFGTSFDDVNTASANSPLLVSKGQDANSYDPPGRLDFGTTYYWRVDEVNAPPSTAIFKGQVWQFTAEPYAYKMTNIIATASSAAAASPVVNTINESGITGDLHGSYPETMWLTPSGGIPAWIQFDFDQVYKMYEMWIWNQNSMFETILGLGAKDTVIEYSADGTNWTSLGDFELAQATGEDTIAPTSTIAFNGLSVKSVRVTINSNWGNPKQQVGLSEVRFLYIPVMAREPKPATGSTGIDLATVVLSWRSGREAASHNIYTGTDPNALTLSGTSTTNSFVPSNLSVSTKCYWRVDEVNAAMTPTTWPSKVWDFTTADFVVVDDMESYNDTDNKIFDTWADGYNTTTNGSQVGYGESANGTFGETTTVHGGKQSMPFGYGNDGITTSEATRTFGTAQDWTAAGVKTLVLFFYGDPTNSAVQLYAKINGKELAYSGAAGNIQRSGWNQWNIDLSSVSGGVKAVKTLTIGARGSGTGLLFIDDIRLYKNAP